MQFEVGELYIFKFSQVFIKGLYLSECIENIPEIRGRYLDLYDTSVKGVIHGGYTKQVWKANSKKLLLALYS